MAKKKTLLLVLATIMFAALITGCTGKSKPARFYTLTPVSEERELAVDGVISDTLAVGIGPVKLADYLSQSRIVTRISDNTIIKAEFDQWSGSLENNMTNVLADNIGNLLGTEKVVLYPWRSYVPIDYQVIVEIIRFDGQPDKLATLEARWIILKGKGKSIVGIKRSRILQTIDTPGYAGLVAGQSKTLGVLAKEIAQTIVDHN